MSPLKERGPYASVVLSPVSLLYETRPFSRRGFEKNIAFLMVVGGAGAAEVSHVPREKGWSLKAGEVAEWVDEVAHYEVLAEIPPRGVGSW